MIPNKTEEQILYNQFKFYDLESSGYCSLSNFIKTNDRLGVVLPEIKDFEVIFDYFADPETSLLNYKKFIHDIFKFKATDLKESKDIDKEDDFIYILTKKIMYRGGPFVLIDIEKNLEMNDFEEKKKLNTEEFLKVLQRCKIFLSPEESRMLYKGSDYFGNDVVKYQKLINILLMQFWDEKKLSLSKEIYYLLTNNGKKDLTFNIMKKYFNDVLQDSEEKKYFLKFIEEYKTTNKINSNKPLNQKDLINFLKYYNFGQNSDVYLTDLINIIRDDDIKDKKKLNIDDKNIIRSINQQQNKRQKKINNFLGKDYTIEYEKFNEINDKLREKFIKFGRKSIFSFLKHFKFYDNNTKCISKYDFSKIIKDFNIQLTVDEIDIIFKIYGTDKIGSSISYEKYFDDLILNYSSKKRQDVIEYIYDTIKDRGESLEREIDISFLKEIYNPKNNYFKEDETDNKLDFDDCLELYHYSYKGNKYDEMSDKEFIEFYLFISFLIPSDEDFIFMISNEWRIPLNKIKDRNNEKKLNNLIKIKGFDINKNLSKISNYAQLGENVNDYQENVYPPYNNNELNDDYSNYNLNKNKPALNRRDFGIDNNNKRINTIKNYDFPKEEKINALAILTDVLRSRGIRGVLYLYSQFLHSCKDINKITFEDFLYVFKIQHIDLGDNVIKEIFSLFSLNNYYLDFYSFIRNYKKELNESKLNVVEQAFSLIDKKGIDKIPLNVIKMRYNAKQHPDVLKGIISEEEKLMEFLDTFDLCYNILKMDSKCENNENDDYVNFEIFANFYEYVSFIYPRDIEFQNVVNSTWN